MPERSRDELLAELRAITARAGGGAAPRVERTGSLLASGRPAADRRGPVKLLVGVEDASYFHWQLAILFESLVGQLPDGWEVMVVVCNDHRRLSDRLLHTLETYGVRYFTGADHPRRADIDVSGGGERYPPFNKIEALNCVSRRVDDEDRICLMDADVFLYGSLDPSVFPAGDALCRTWVIAEHTRAEHQRELGRIDLRRVLESVRPGRDFVRGGVTVFLTGQTVRRPKFVRDCFRFTQVVYLLGRIAGLDSVWMAELPSYALALAANGIEPELIDADAFVIDKRPALRPGAFYHYYVDLADGGSDGAFHRSTWCKHGYRQRDLLEDDLGGFERAAATDHERVFFRLAGRARDRLSDALRGTQPAESHTGE